MAYRRRFPSKLGVVLAAVLLGAPATGCQVHPPISAAPPPPAITVRSTADIVAAALPAVVLLINERPNDKPGGPPITTFGAGFLTRDGLVVTSLHVVDGDGKLSAMLYKRGRQSYTPMDGGLGRFLFENQADLVAAERVGADAVTDLAVLRIKTDTQTLPRLVWATDDVRPGDRVLALGHPQETVWSFSQGVVGALQYGILQHDATVGPGSSGGPLLNDQGEVVGVNIAKVMNQPSGLSFARPIAIVASTFSDKKVVSPLDQSTPAAAALSCWRAQELALSDTADCFDWDRGWEQFAKVASEARRLATTGAVRDTIDSCHLGPQAKAAWTAMQREHTIHVLDPSYQKAQKEAKRKAEEKAAESGEEVSSEACDMPPPNPADDRFTADYKDPQKLAVRLRNGLRVEGTHFARRDLAWVLLASRGADGSVAQFTELYAQINGKWLQRALPDPEEIKALPAGWPTPVMTHAAKRPMQIASILKEAATMDQCPFGPPKSDAASTGGAGRAILRSGFSADL